MGQEACELNRHLGWERESNSSSFKSCDPGSQTWRFQIGHPNVWVSSDWEKNLRDHIHSVQLSYLQVCVAQLGKGFQIFDCPEIDVSMLGSSSWRTLHCSSVKPWGGGGMAPKCPWTCGQVSPRSPLTSQIQVLLVSASGNLRCKKNKNCEHWLAWFDSWLGTLLLKNLIQVISSLRAQFPHL